MRIVSFTTQHCLDYLTQVSDFQNFADAIAALGADVVGLNEMRGAGLTDEERLDFYKALSSIAENLRSRIEAEAYHI